MSAQINISIATSNPLSFVKSRVYFGTNVPRVLLYFRQFINGLLGGSYNGQWATMTVGGVAAYAVVTYTGQPADADTVTFNGVALTAKTTVTNTATQFAIGADADATYENLVNLINTYSTNKLLRQTVIAEQDKTANTVTVRAKIPGTIGNASGGLYTAAESLGNATLATFANGTDGEVDITYL
jgi:hypothetical protein